MAHSYPYWEKTFPGLSIQEFMRPYPQATMGAFELRAEEFYRTAYGRDVPADFREQILRELARAGRSRRDDER
jgi:hypothetical protein